MKFSYLLLIMVVLLLPTIGKGMEIQEKPLPIKKRTLTLTDVQGVTFTLTPEQTAAFCSCGIYTNFKEHELQHDHENQRQREVAIKQIDANTKDYTAVKNARDAPFLNVSAICTSEDEKKGWNFQDCTQTFLTQSKMLRLLNKIQNGKTKRKISTSELPDFFELALYFDAPEPIIEKFAQTFYDSIAATKETDLAPRLAKLKNLAAHYLPYYPNVSFFLEDYKKSTHTISELLKYNRNRLDISADHLQFLGFTKKIHSLDGIEKLKEFFAREVVIEEIYAPRQKIKDFSFENLKKIYPDLNRLDLSNNKIKHLHKYQLGRIKDKCWIILSNNSITRIEPDCFSRFTYKSALELILDNVPLQFNQVKFAISFFQKITLKGLAKLAIIETGLIALTVSTTPAVKVFFNSIDKNDYALGGLSLCALTMVSAIIVSGIIQNVQYCIKYTYQNNIIRGNNVFIRF